MKMFGYALWVLHLFVYVAERKWERERETMTEKEYETDKEMRCVI